MAHVLAKLSGVPLEEVRIILKRDASLHAKQGLFLEHLWKNTNNPYEVLFLFQTKDLHHAQEFVNHMHEQTRHQNPNANLPEMTFLES